MTIGVDGHEPDGDSGVQETPTWILSLLHQAYLQWPGNQGASSLYLKFAPGIIRQFVAHQEISRWSKRVWHDHIWWEKVFRSQIDGISGVTAMSGSEAILPTSLHYCTSIQFTCLAVQLVVRKALGDLFSSRIMTLLEVPWASRNCRVDYSSRGRFLQAQFSATCTYFDSC